MLFLSPHIAYKTDGGTESGRPEGLPESRGQQAEGRGKGRRKKAVHFGAKCLYCRFQKSGVYANQPNICADFKEGVGSFWNDYPNDPPAAVEITPNFR